MTAEEFCNDEVKRLALREALEKNPIISEAMTVLFLEVSPKDTQLTEANPTVATARFHKAAGANHIIEGLGRLTKPFRKPVALKGRELLKDPNPQ